MFDKHGIERLTCWKYLRDKINQVDNPLFVCADYWKMAPYVSPFLDPSDPDSWPDPWKLILDGKYDNLAISLGMLYTLKLTDRFKNMDFQIYLSQNKKEPDFFLTVGDLGVLNMSYGSVEPIIKLQDYEISKVYPKNS